uniref:Uncharacterized protein n=1 Tax=Chromera velia CCMP2878 TaxID=1169474 RepID=A0A0G4FTK6_9ALVE|eukprot:Cvel_18689.t1-p1 / transcript=Cvel_18689.t1 / gene=Cvel_18689 / organism=Chromera_velia_CCMP2878 / gene_product=hypothetical protein / transcript_product=hypothetical protein / location=Cvel_scaffold1564:20411-22768(+) / protein_length=786 / sequence_SO=supercontig / SO=protein_coding / is_pseudo=false
MQRSLRGVVSLFGDLGGAESLVRSVFPAGIMSGSEESSAQEFLASVDTLRRERSERAHHVLFSVYLPHLRLVRSRFDEKKKRVAALIGSWSSACVQKKTRAEWLDTLSDAERGLWKFVCDEAVPPHLKAHLSCWRDFQSALKVVWDLPSVWKLLLLKAKNPASLATQLMMPVLLWRRGYYKVQKSVQVDGGDHPFDRALPNVKLLAPVDRHFLSLRRDVLLALWEAATANDRIPGRRTLCQWLVTASHVGDSETVGMIGSHLTEQQNLSSAQWVARRIDSFNLRSSGRVMGSGDLTRMGWRFEVPSSYLPFFENIRALPLEKRRALIYSQAEKISGTSEGMKRFFLNTYNGMAGMGGGSQTEAENRFCKFGNPFDALRCLYPTQHLESFRPDDRDVLFWYVDSLEAEVLEFEITKRQMNPDQIVRVPNDKFNWGEGEWVEMRAVDNSLLRACSVGFPRLVVGLLRHGGNPKVMKAESDDHDHPFWVPLTCDPVCRVAIEAMNDGRGLGKGGEFCRFWVCVRELLKAGGDPCVFLNLLENSFIDRWIDHRDPRNTDEEEKRDPTPFCYPSRLLRLQPRVMRLRVLLRLCAEFSLKRRRRQDGDGSQREAESDEDREILGRLRSFASALCQRDEEYNTGRRRHSSADGDGEEGSRPEHGMISLFFEPREPIQPPNPSDSLSALPSESLTAPQPVTDATAPPSAPPFICTESVDERMRIFADEMIFLDRSLDEAWQMVRRWGLRPADAPPCFRLPKTPDSLCESLWLQLEESGEASGEETGSPDNELWT